MKQNQIKLDKTKRYNISELNEEQINQILEVTDFLPIDYLNRNKHLVLYCYEGQWLLDAFNYLFKIDETEEIINAKTLFK